MTKFLKKIKKFIRKGYIPKCESKLAPYTKVLDQLTISESGLIMKGDKIVLPEKLVELSLRKAHQGGHPGMTSMKRRLRSHFWCPNLNKRVEEMVKGCKECTMFTPKTKKNHLHPHKLKEFNAWEKLSIDLFGPLPDHRHIIVAQDMLSKFPAAKILEKTDAAHVTAALGEFYTAYGTPVIHRTDNGPPFNSKEFEQFSKTQGIIHEKAFPYHPQANPAEGFMKPLGKCMKTSHVSGTNKQHAMNQFLASYRATPHSATGIAPGDILFRHGYGVGFPQSCPPSDEAVREALEQDQAIRETRDNKLNLARKKEVNFQIGDKVYTKNNKHTKFQPAFGPTEKTITSIENGGVTCVDKQGSSQTRHPDDIKPAPTAAPVEPLQGGNVDTTETIDSNLEDRGIAQQRPVRSRRPPDYYQC